MAGDLVLQVQHAGQYGHPPALMLSSLHIILLPGELSLELVASECDPPCPRSFCSRYIVNVDAWKALSCRCMC